MPDLVDHCHQVIVLCRVRKEIQYAFFRQTADVLGLLNIERQGRFRRSVNSARFVNEVKSSTEKIQGFDPDPELYSVSLPYPAS